MDENQAIILVKSYKFFQFIICIQTYDSPQPPFLRKNGIHLTVKSEHQFTGSETDFKQSQQHQVATS